MTRSPVLETERLRLRLPTEADFEGFAALMSDPVATEYIGGTVSVPHAWRALCMILGHWRLRGYGFFTVEDKVSGAWVGRVGPWYPHGWAAPEIGWSVTRAHWGKGYGPEAAAASMDFVFEQLGWDRVIHLIHPDNANSQAVARKLGSVDTGEDAEAAGFGMMCDVWGQSRADWAQNRKRFDCLQP